MSNSLDPDQARHYVGPDLGPNCCEGHQQRTQVGKELNALSLQKYMAPLAYTQPVYLDLFVYQFYSFTYIIFIDFKPPLVNRKLLYAFKIECLCSHIYAMCYFLYQLITIWFLDCMHIKHTVKTQISLCLQHRLIWVFLCAHPLRKTFSRWS